MAHVLKVAITGNIASGKTYVLEKLSKKFKALNSDSLVNALYAKSFFRKILKKHFGTFDKKKIAGLIFNNSAKRKKLERLIWPFVREDLKEFFAKNKNKKILLVEVPLLYESKMQTLFDLVIFIECKKENQLARLLKKGFSRKEALARINSQGLAEKKIKLADIVLENNASLKQLNKKIDSLIIILGRICFLSDY